MDSQVTLRFDNRDSAEAYAKAHGIDYTVVEPKTRRPNLRPTRLRREFRNNAPSGLDTLTV